MSMSMNQKNKATLGKLKKQLCHFGLNPQHWEIRKEKETLKRKVFLIQHRNEKNFCFQGKAVINPTCTYWQDMCLISL